MQFFSDEKSIFQTLNDFLIVLINISLVRTKILQNVIKVNLSSEQF